MRSPRALADFGGRRGQEAAATAEGQAAPAVGVLRGDGDGAPDVIGLGQGAARHDHRARELVGVESLEDLAACEDLSAGGYQRDLDGFTPRLFHPAPADAFGPGAVGGQRPIRVRFVAETAVV
jgi:hypothetical protein